MNQDEIASLSQRLRKKVDIGITPAFGASAVMFSDARTYSF